MSCHGDFDGEWVVNKISKKCFSEGDFRESNEKPPQVGDPGGVYCC